MALPWTFANAATLFTSRLDDNYNALGALTVIPCTATGTNTIALTPVANTPTISAYSNLAPVFLFLAAASNSGATTVNVNGIGAKNLYKNNGATAVGSGDIVIGGLYLVSYNSALNGAVGGFVIDNPATTAAQNTTTTKLITGGPLTYNSPAGVVRHRVRMIGGGGGGGAVATNTGSNGTASSFQVNATGTAWTAAFGNGGVNGGGTRAGGAGGTGGSIGATGVQVTRFDGAMGSDGAGSVTGGAGANSVFGGAGGSRSNSGQNNAVTNSGAGGSGGFSGGVSGGGGGAGEYVEFWVTGMTTATYTVGAGGAGGLAGTIAGGAGGAGCIIIEEFYQ